MNKIILSILLFAVTSHAATERGAADGQKMRANLDEAIKEQYVDSAKTIRNYMYEKRREVLKNLIDSGEITERLIGFTKNGEPVVPGEEMRRRFADLKAKGMLEEVERFNYAYRDVCLAMVNGKLEPQALSTLPLPFNEVCVDLNRLTNDFLPKVDDLVQILRIMYLQPPDNELSIRIAKYFEKNSKLPENIRGLPSTNALDSRKLMAWLGGLVIHDLARHLGFDDDNHRFAAAVTTGIAAYTQLIKKDFTGESAGKLMLRKGNVNVLSFTVKLVDLSPNSECREMTKARNYHFEFGNAYAGLKTLDIARPLSWNVASIEGSYFYLDLVSDGLFGFRKSKFNYDGCSSENLIVELYDNDGVKVDSIKMGKYDHLLDFEYTDVIFR